MDQHDKPAWLAGIKGEAVPKLIGSDSRVIRVIAGPGSGKTTALKRRVQRLLQETGVAPEKIFVGTFTRAIAGELVEAVGLTFDSDDLGEHDGAGHVRVSTLHSHALRLVRANPTARPGRDLRFLLEFEKDVMLYDIGEALADGRDHHARKRELKRVCAAWAEGMNLEIAGFIGEMNRWLRRHGGMLIDEVVNLARIGLESGDIPAGEFDHVIIDEYQDLTAAEQQLVEQIWSGGGSLVVLGDDDQSIYSFRFNHPGGITEFVHRWEAGPFEDVGIPDNRRSGHVIVDLANAMMAGAKRTKAPMVAQREDEGELALVYWGTAQEEVAGLARYMHERSDTRFLVLVPRRFVGYRLKKAVGADAVTSFQEEALEVPLAQERFALASLVAHPEDRVALRAALGFHANGTEFGPKRNAPAYGQIIESPLAGVAFLEALANGSLKPRGSGSSHLRARATEILRTLAGLPDDAAGKINAVFDPSLAAKLADEDDREKARLDLEHLRAAALGIHGRMKKGDLGKVLDQLRYRIAMRIPSTDSQNARVRIMTLHGAKGLEADVVIIAGAADQIIPGHLPEDPTEAERKSEEQRRLLYVSVTRAQRELVVSWPRSMPFKDAKKNQVRIDGDIWTRRDRQYVALGRTRLLPDVPQKPQTGSSWLKAKLGVEAG